MKVNLLSEELKAKKAVLFAGPLNLKGLILGFGIFGLILGLCFFFIGYNINYCKGQLGQIQSGWDDTEPLLKEKESLIKRKQEVEGFHGLLKETLGRDISWLEKLAALPELLPDEVWLQELSFKREGQNPPKRILDIRAAVGYLSKDEELLDKINNMVDNIKKDKAFFKEFNDLNLLEINKTRQTTQENIMDFKIKLILK